MSSTKGPWEDRVRDLLIPVSAFYHKCPDRIASGRARLDFTGIYTTGEGYIIEVKQAKPRKTSDWKPYAEKDSSALSPLQWMELAQAKQKGVTYVEVAVGIEDKLYLFNFDWMSKKYGKELFWPVDQAYWTYTWLGPKEWKTHEWAK